MILIIFADQITKWLCVALLEGRQSVYIIPDVLRLTYVENRGAAFGMLDEHRWIFLVLSTLTIIGLFIFLAKKTFLWYNRGCRYIYKESIGILYSIHCNGILSSG